MTADSDCYPAKTISTKLSKPYCLTIIKNTTIWEQ